ncbi:MAG: AAA family ATPase [Actinobacteria bacterium]|nr:AAA family ATPase [Actinomycetota bacterium]
MIALTDPDKGTRAYLAKALGSAVAISHHETVVDLEHALAMAPVAPAVAVFGPNVPLDDGLQTATWLQDRGTPTAAILIAHDLSAEVLHAAMRAGVRDVLPESHSADQLRDTVDRALGLASRVAGSTGTAPERLHSKIVTVFSTKGGSGKSVVASNLAMLLAEETGEEVVLVDLDLQSGDLAIMLQLTPAWTIYDAAENTSRLDLDALVGYLTPHRSGISLLAAPLEPALAETITGQTVQEILTLLTERFPYVIVDGPAVFSDQVIAALDVSHETVLMASLDVPSIKNLKLALQTFEQLGIGRDRTHVVLNRADSKVGLRLQEVEHALGTPIDVLIPSSRDVPLSVNQGQPLAIENRRSPVVASISKLAGRIRIPAHTGPKRGRRALLGRN